MHATQGVSKCGDSFDGKWYRVAFEDSFPEWLRYSYTLHTCLSFQFFLSRTFVSVCVYIRAKTRRSSEFAVLLFLVHFGSPAWRFFHVIFCLCWTPPTSDFSKQQTSRNENRYGAVYQGAQRTIRGELVCCSKYVEMKQRRRRKIGHATLGETAVDTFYISLPCFCHGVRSSKVVHMSKRKYRSQHLDGVAVYE